MPEKTTVNIRDKIKEERKQKLKDIEKEKKEKKERRKRRRDEDRRGPLVGKWRGDRSLAAFCRRRPAAPARVPMMARVGWPLRTPSAHPREAWIRRMPAVRSTSAPQPDGHDNPRDLGGDNDPVMGPVNPDK